MAVKKLEPSLLDSRKSVALRDDPTRVDPTFGNAPRTTTSVLSPGTRNAELALFKEFSLGTVHEGMRLEFRAEATNALNHPQFRAPNSNAKSGNFGLIVPNGAGVVTVNSPRELQLGLKLYF